MGCVHSAPFPRVRPCTPETLAMLCLSTGLLAGLPSKGLGMVAELHRSLGWLPP